MQSPYADLPKKAFWKQGVAERKPDELGLLYTPRLAVSRTDRVVTAGSCFAQHVGRVLRQAGFNVVDAEPAPAELDSAIAQKFGYGLFSARYANIYTVRQLLQLFRESEGRFTPADPVWEKDGRYYDSQRPGVEPDGFETPELVAFHRKRHLAAVSGAFRNADVFVFTFGLTEAFIHRESGTVFPTAPGTIAGSYDPAVHAFHNFRPSEVLADFLAFRAELKAVNPGVRFLVTTSPVPLTATASGKHVEVATTWSKAVLRAVCGELYDTLDDLDYFPSYEIITSQKARGGYYEDNLRSVSAAGVATAMSVFLAAQGASAAGVAISSPAAPAPAPAAAPAAAAPAAAPAAGKEGREARKAERLARRAERHARRGGKAAKGPRRADPPAAAAEPAERPQRPAKPGRAARKGAAERPQRPAKPGRAAREGAAERKGGRRNRPDAAAAAASPATAAPDEYAQSAEADVVCEDALLEAFRK